MTKFKITKGSEKDFEGAPNEALVRVKHRNGSTVFAEKFKFEAAFWREEDHEVAGKMDGYYKHGEVIASREPITEPVPDADGWIEWNGGECPVGKGVLVDVKYRDGIEKYNLPADITGARRDASQTFWDNDNYGSDIIAYRLSKPEVAEAPAWNGEGLPPVGVEVEWRTPNHWIHEWSKGVINYISDFTVVFGIDVAEDPDKEVVMYRDQVTLRPIRSPEEIEREKAIDETVYFFVNHYGNPKGSEGYINIASALYDAGYRKVGAA